MGHPPQQQRSDDGTQAVGRGLVVGAFVHPGIEAALADLEGNRLRADDLAAAQQDHPDVVIAGRHVGREIDGAVVERPVVELDRDDVRPKKAGGLLDPHQTGREGGRIGRTVVVRRNELQAPEADLLARLRRRRHHVVERLAAGDGIEARNALEVDAVGVQPDAGDALLAAHGVVRGRAAEHDHDVAVTLLDAIDEHVDAGEPCGDGDTVIHEISDEQLLRAGGRPERQQHGQQAGNADQTSPSGAHWPITTGVREYSSVGVAINSKDRRSPSPRTRAASKARSSSARTRLPTRPPIWAPMTPPISSRKASMTSTVWFCTACRKVTLAVTKMVWNSEVPTTMRVGMPSR